MIELKNDKTYLITGGAGFLGKALVERLYSDNYTLRVLGRDEGNLISLKEKFPKIEIYTGDISDPFEVRQAMKGITGVFHLAASKHVGLAEVYVRENIKTNVIGSLNIYNESLNSEIEFVLAISTDKAAQVSGVYGATKLLMEGLANQFERLNSNCKYRVVRYGNVLYSTGSVLCKWKNLIQQGYGVIVTEPEATRFFWTVDQAVDLIEACMRDAVDSKPYCPSMKAMKVGDLLTAMIEKYSEGKNIPIKVIGLQPGENLHEKVLSSGPYSNQVEHFTVAEIKHLI